MTVRAVSQTSGRAAACSHDQSAGLGTTTDPFLVSSLMDSCSVPPGMKGQMPSTSSPGLKPESGPASCTTPEKSSATPFCEGTTKLGRYGHSGNPISCASTGLMDAAWVLTRISEGFSGFVSAGRVDCCSAFG